MRQDLEDLWNYYLIEVPIKNTKKEKSTIEAFSKKRKAISVKADARTA